MIVFNLCIIVVFFLVAAFCDVNRKAKQVKNVKP